MRNYAETFNDRSNVVPKTFYRYLSVENKFSHWWL